MADGAVRPDRAVASPLHLIFCRCTNPRQKPSRNWSLRPEFAVSAFREGLVCGLPRPGKVQRYAVHLCPEAQRPADELLAFIHPDILGVQGIHSSVFTTSFALKPFLVSLVGLKRVKAGVDDGQDAQPRTG